MLLERETCRMVREKLVLDGNLDRAIEQVLACEKDPYSLVDEILTSFMSGAVGKGGAHACAVHAAGSSARRKDVRHYSMPSMQGIACTIFSGTLAILPDDIQDLNKE